MTDDSRVRADSIPVQPAATVMLLRDGDVGVEVFMLQRTLGAVFARGQYVFPGGKVDDADRATVFEPFCDGLDDATASARMGMAEGGLAWLVAAVRECFEEAGILLARRDDEATSVRFDDDAVAERFEHARHEIHEGRATLVDVCEAEGLRLLVDRIHLVDHWITPVGERRRFDTRFFVAEAPVSQRPLHDDKETIASLWTTPGDALSAWERGELSMFPPTAASLRFLAAHDTVASVVAAAEKAGIPTPILPRLITDADGNVVGVKRPGEDGYDDVVVPEYVIGHPR